MTTEPDPVRTPVIVGVGELADRPDALEHALEPASLMAEALRRAEADAGAPLLAALERLDVVREVSWPYADAGAQVLRRLGGTGVTTVHHPVGGQTPLLALHEAALQITAGEIQVAAVCGAEAQASVNAARKLGLDLAWTAPDPDARALRGGDFQAPLMRALDLAIPTHVYPFYEAATRAAWGQTLEAAQAESGVVWAANAAVAKTRDAAWIRRDIGAEEIVQPSPQNRLIAWPYTKLMVANPMVNQGAAAILCSAAYAEAAGVPRERWVHVLAGSAADEPRNILHRRDYRRSEAMEAVLRDAMEALAQTGRARFDHLELYSCFPCVPKMARRVLGAQATQPLTVAGGLTFFGAPLNNYMTHAAVAMVQRLREAPFAARAALRPGRVRHQAPHAGARLASAPRAVAPQLPPHRRRGGAGCRRARPHGRLWRAVRGRDLHRAVRPRRRGAARRGDRAHARWRTAGRPRARDGRRGHRPPPGSRRRRARRKPRRGHDRRRRRPRVGLGRRRVALRRPAVGLDSARPRPDAGGLKRAGTGNGLGS